MEHKSKISISHKPYDYSDVPGAGVGASLPPTATAATVLLAAAAAAPSSAPSISESARSSVTENESETELADTDADLAGLNVVIPDNYWAATALLNDGANLDDPVTDSASAAPLPLFEFEYPEPRLSVQSLDESSEKEKNVFAEKVQDFKKAKGMKESSGAGPSGAGVKKDWKYWNAVGLGLIRVGIDGAAEAEEFNSEQSQSSQYPRPMSATSESDTESVMKYGPESWNWNRDRPSTLARGQTPRTPTPARGRGRGRTLLDEIKRVESFHRDGTSVKRIGQRIQIQDLSGAVARDKSTPHAHAVQTVSSTMEEADQLEPLPPYRGKKISTLVAQRVLGPHGIRISVPPGSDNMNPLQQQMVAGTEHLPISRFLQNIPAPVPRTMEQLSRINARTKLPWRYHPSQAQNGQNQAQGQGQRSK